MVSKPETILKKICKGFNFSIIPLNEFSKTYASAFGIIDPEEVKKKSKTLSRRADKLKTTAYLQYEPILGTYCIWIPKPRS